MSALTISAISMCFMCKICGWTIPSKPGFVVLRLKKMKEKRAVANAGDGNACGLGPDQLKLAAARHLAAADRQFTNQ
jgi:hypothetical protein